MLFGVIHDISCVIMNPIYDKEVIKILNIKHMISSTLLLKYEKAYVTHVQTWYLFVAE